MNKKFWLTIVIGPAMALLLAAGIQAAVSHELKWRADIAQGQERINHRLSRIEEKMGIEPENERQTHVATRN